MAKAPIALAGSEAQCDVGMVDVSNRPLILRQIIAEDLAVSLGHTPDAKEVDDATLLAMHLKTRAARVAAFRVEVVPSPVPFAEVVLRVSHDAGESWTAINLLPEERVALEAAL
jgi:hypothetical protein